MVTKKAVILYGVLLLVLGVVWVKTNFISSETNSVPQARVPEVQISPSSSKGTQPLNFFEKDNFYEGVLYAKQYSYSFGYKAVGGIIPHHLLPSYIIADFFNRLTSQKPSTIILIGPNHYEKGNHGVLSSDFDWQTPFGIVEPHQEVIDDLRSNKLLGIDNHVMANEHSVGGIMPYIKYYLPNVTVVPIIVKRGVGLEEINALASSLSSHVDGGAVVLASVDFSHYLSSEEARQKDEITLQAIRRLDYKSLLSFDSDYLDSPSSIVLLLKIMQMKGATTRELLHHTNSGILQNNLFQPTTSYISIGIH